MQSAPKNALVTGANTASASKSHFSSPYQCCTVLLGALNKARGDEAVAKLKIEMAGILEVFCECLVGSWIG